MNKNVNVLLLTHSNIMTDARILKSMSAIEDHLSIDVYGFGLEDNYEKHYGTYINDRLRNFDVNTKKYLKFFQYYKVLKFLRLTLKFYFQSKEIKPTVVHVNDWPSLLAGVLIKKKHKSKLIYDAHELESKTNGLGKFMAKFIFFLEKFLWTHIDYLICASEHYITWYTENIGFKQNVCVLNSPVKSEETFSSLNFNDLKINSVVNFIYVGFLTSGRGVQILLDLFTKEKLSSHLSFLGYGPLENLVKSHSDRFPNIHYFPPVPHEQVVSLLSNFDFGISLIENISLSDYYCAPNKLFEYAFSGLPVIASDFPEMKYYVEKHNLGYCISPNIEDLKKLINTIENEPLISHNPINLEEISWDKQALKLSKVYKSLLS